MLGVSIDDPEVIEGTPGITAGLGLLDMRTTITPHKKLENVAGRLSLDGSPVTGYEIHAGVTTGPALDKPAVLFEGRGEGAVSDDGQLLGTYLHGVFEKAEACNALLEWAGLKRPAAIDYKTLREKEIDRLAGTLESSLDVDAILRLLDPVQGRLRSGT